MVRLTRVRRPLRPAALCVLAAGVAGLLAGCLPPPPLGPVGRPGTVAAPRYANTADPFVLKDGGTFYLFGSDAGLRAPVITSASLDGSGTRTEAMPSPVPWSSRPGQLWAPTVGRFAGRWAMFFAADRPNPPDPANPQCIGRAWANAPAGPYVAEALPVHCGVDGRGILDPQIFDGPDGQRWLLVAVGNTGVPIQTIKLDDNANLVTAPFGIYARTHAWEGRFLENPAMVYDAAAGNYVLTYSAGDWWTPAYSIGVARCASPLGFCSSSAEGPWISSASGRTGPGGLSFFNGPDGGLRAVYSSFAAGAEGTAAPRAASFVSIGIGGSLTAG